MRSREELDTIAGIMHDAELLSVEWDPTLAQVSLLFDCLRRNSDSSEMEDRTVEFRLGGIQAITSGYESWNPSVRPSEIVLPRRIDIENLYTLHTGSMGDIICINSLRCNESVTSAAIADWLYGNFDSYASSDYQVWIALNGEEIVGVPGIRVEVLFACDDFSISSGSVPFDLNTWKAQSTAWWDYWKKHWDEKENGDEGEGDITVEDIFIPGGESEVNLDYSPPNEPAFELEPSDVPQELLVPLRNLFEGHLAEDWLRVASAKPDPCTTVEQQAEKMREDWLRGDSLWPSFGFWGYARSVDSWWIEGKRACVNLRGVEHCIGDEEGPPENNEAIWNFSLRLAKGKWIIRTYLSSYANADPERRLPVSKKPWLKRWRSGKIR